MSDVLKLWFIQARHIHKNIWQIICDFITFIIWVFGELETSTLRFI